MQLFTRTIGSQMPPAVHGPQVGIGKVRSALPAADAMHAPVPRNSPPPAPHRTYPRLKPGGSHPWMRCVVAVPPCVEPPAAMPMSRPWPPPCAVAPRRAAASPASASLRAADLSFSVWCGGPTALGLVAELDLGEARHASGSVQARDAPCMASTTACERTRARQWAAWRAEQSAGGLFSPGTSQPDAARV